MQYEHLYVHVPFCARRCVYCDFSIAVRRDVPVDEYLRALDGEWTARHTANEFVLNTVYFGGGTPSKLGGDGVRRLMDLVRRRAAIAANAEVTLEVNPEDVTGDAVSAWLGAGINRLSIGVQSFDDTVLTWMHRTHDAGAARRAVAVALDAGATNISIDLIYALPASLSRDWKSDVEAAIALGTPHVSVYGLTVEPRTPLGRWVALATVAEAPEESYESDFLFAHEALSGAGFEHYEVSNYGRPGMHSRHNWSYWNRAPYAGLGPSAHEFDGRRRRWNLSPYADWAERAARRQDPTEGMEAISAEQAAAEAAYLGLRTTSGTRIVESDREVVRPWIESGWATLDADLTLRLATPGWLRLDSIAADLTRVRSRY